MTLARRLRILLPALLAAALLATGCGGDDGGGGGLSGSDEKQCLEAAEKLDGQSRDLAEAACKGDQEKVKDESLEQCLDAARQFPEDSRKTAEKRCREAIK